ncbi:hypothetical protein [Endozoicomonas sp. ISHI1]|uniref:hypothetical protein n=1 Tax=Endozoicomonas sp. ISHI1 TaxID=2825882 RepID=UPI002147BD44|nr:hypothetical protein [Endozoicomonas sp. ISHI1]
MTTENRSEMIQRLQEWAQSNSYTFSIINEKSQLFKSEYEKYRSFVKALSDTSDNQPICTTTLNEIERQLTVLADGAHWKAGKDLDDIRNGNITSETHRDIHDRIDCLQRLIELRNHVLWLIETNNNKDQNHGKDNSQELSGVAG